MGTRPTIAVIGVLNLIPACGLYYILVASGYRDPTTLIILVGLVLVLGFVLLRTQTGIYIRAIADDVEAGDIVGIPTRAVAIGVWTFSGALAGLGGALIVPMTASVSAGSASMGR